MRKVLRNRDLNERPIARTLLALSLVASLAAFGCTTNSMRGEGEPYTGGPGVGPGTPTSGTSSGTSVPTTPPPMTSSYTRADEQGAITTRSRSFPLSAGEAAAVMAQHQSQPRVRVLGQVNPGPAGRPYASDGIVTGQVLNSAAITNPQYSINSSISSPPFNAVTTGVGAGGSSSDSGAAVFTQSLTTATPTVLGAVVPPPTASTTGNAVAARTTTTNGAVASITPTTSITAASSTAPTAIASGTAGVRVGTINNANAATVANGSVRVLTANGRVVVTNVSQSGSKQQ